MKFNIRYILYVVLGVLVLTSCNREDLREIEEVLMTKEDVSLTIRKELIFTYDSSKCQLAYNDKRNEFRVMTDDMSEYFVLTADQPLSHEGQELKADLIYTLTGSAKTDRSLGFTIQKVEGSSGLFWLWCSSRKIGVVVKRL